MKKIVLLAVALITMVNVQAESRNDRNQQAKVENQIDRRHHVKKDRRHHKDGNPAELMTERMAKELNLSDAQKAQVLELNKKYADMFRRPGHHGQHPGRPGMRKGPQQRNGQDLQKGQTPQNGKGCCDTPAPAAETSKSCCDTPAPAVETSKSCCDKPAQADKSAGKKMPRKRPDMKELKAKREAYNKELKAILTKDQYKLYQQQQKERKEKMKEHQHHKA